MSAQPSPGASRAVFASGFALLVSGACVLAFLPPLVYSTVESVPKTALFGLTIACGLTLHLVFLGIAAHRLGRRPWVWVLLALLLLPIGSIVGLVLFGWFNEERASIKATQAG